LAGRAKFKLIVGVPSSYLSTEPDPRHKAIKAGILGRILAVYRVDEVAVYDDRPAYWRDGELLVKLLEYMVVAPYIRKRVFPPNVPELRYAGVLPPLQLPTHGAGGPVVGEVREAFVVRVSGRRAFVDAGLGDEISIEVPSNVRLRRGERVLVRIEQLKPKPKLSLVLEDVVYRGFTTRRFESLRRVFYVYNKCLKVATSRKGEVKDFNFYLRLVDEASDKGCLIILFGAPDLGLYEIAELEGFKLENYANYIINLIPCQGTKTVRVEEAVAAALTLVNLARCLKTSSEA
jgi:predicted SPOUT superfamily RNA methylase MTH1